MTEFLLVGERNGPLQSVQHAIAAREPQWTMRCCASEASALEACAMRPADVVVASCQSTAAFESFFAGLSRSGCRAIRVALRRDRSEPVDGAHQVLESTGSADTLVVALEAAANVAGQLARDKSLGQLLAQFRHVPSPPLLYLDLRDHMTSTNASVASLAEMASRDPAVVARTLTLANSGYFARPRTIGSLVSAIQLIGVDALLAVVLATRMFAGLPPPGLRLETLWQHAAAVASLAKRLCELDGGNREQAGHSYLAGLLHDLGLLVLLQNESARYPAMLHESRGVERHLVELERETFGTDHGALGATLLSLWLLPDEVVNAVGCSHGGCDKSLSPPERAVLTAEWLLGLDLDADVPAPPTELGEVGTATIGRWVSARDELFSARVA